MFDDEKENENWDDINLDEGVSSDEPSWDEILDSAVVQSDLDEEENIGENSSYNNDVNQHEISHEPQNSQVYDALDDEPVVEVSRQSRETEDVSDLYFDGSEENEELQGGDYSNFEADNYEENQTQEVYTTEQKEDVNNTPKPIGIKQDKKNSITPVILGALVAVFFACAGYLGYNYLKENNLIPSNGVEQNESLNNQNQDEENMFDDVGEPQAQEPQSESTEQQMPQPQTQAQEPAKDKVVVTVTNTGRANPFTPTGNFSEAGYTIPKGLDIIAPPSYDEDVTPNKLVDISVSGILYDNYKPSAIITIGGMDHFVQRGDAIDEYVVSYIGPTSVTIRSGKNTYTASIGQQFNVNDKIQGETTYVKTKNGTTRQYFTPSSEKIEEE